MKLYILPYYYYENYLKDDFNIFKRDYNLYQFDDILFLFYNTYTSLLKYNKKYTGLSSNIDNYDFNLNFPEIHYGYSNPYFILSKYNGEFDEVKVICPNNEFMLDEFKFVLKKLKVHSFTHIIENDFENKDPFFYEHYDGEEVQSGIGTTIYYTMFLNYLNHLVNMFFIKSTVSVSMNLFKLLIYLNIKENEISNRIKKLTLIDGNDILAYQIINDRLIKNKDNNLYTIQNWKDRYISHKYFEGIIINIDNVVYTTEDKIDINEIINIKDSNKILTENLIDLEEQLPQETIKKTLEEYDIFTVDNNDTINFIPNWNISYFSLKEDLLVSKQIISSCIHEEFDYIEEVIKANLKIIIKQLKGEYQNNGLPLGICPGCNKGYIWQSSKGFYCDQCDKFVLWNKSIESKLGFTPNKYQIKHMLYNNRMFSIKNRKYKLIEYESNKNKFWSIVKLK